MQRRVSDGGAIGNHDAGGRGAPGSIKGRGKMTCMASVVNGVYGTWEGAAATTDLFGTSVTIIMAATSRKMPDSENGGHVLAVIGSVIKGEMRAV